MDLKTFAVTITQIAEEKGLTQEAVMEIVETALAAAYKKEFGKRGQIIKSKFNPDKGEVSFWQVKVVVDESMLKPEEEVAEQEKEKGEGEGKEEEKKEEGAGAPSEDKRSPVPVEEKEARKPQEQEQEKKKEEKEEEEEREEVLAEGELLDKKVKFSPEKHIMIEEAKAANPDVKPGDEVTFPLETKLDFGRIAAQTAKQVIIQRIREAEKETIFSDLKSKEGEILSGMVQRVEGSSVFVDIGKTTGLLPPPEQIPGETYRIGQRLKALLLKVEESPRGTVAVLSRAYPKMISKLFELEVPEVAAGTVIIKSIAREPGARSKIAVSSTEKSIDPIGSCVGQKGTRVNAVITELNGEKIDIIAWTEDSAKYVANALSPAKTAKVEINKERGEATAYVPEGQLSLAIGREGQNVRLAAKLTGWKIDVRPHRGETPEGETPQESKLPAGQEKEETKTKNKEKIEKKDEETNEDKTEDKAKENDESKKKNNV